MRRRAPVVAVSGPSGAGKTRLLARLIPALARRGVSVAVLKHTRHLHPFDRPGKDTDVLRRAGAVAAAIEGPAGLAWFGPPAGSLRALLDLLPPVDLVLAEGWKREAVPRVEVHRRSVAREFLCARDRRVFAVVTDEAPPRPLPALHPDDPEALAALLCARFGLPGRTRTKARLPGRPGVSTVRADPGERTVALGRRNRMAKTTSRTSRKSTAKRASSSRARGSRGGRSAAGRKGGNATLRNRGPEFYSEIGRKGGRSRSRNARRTAQGRGGRKSTSSSRGTSRRGGSRTSRRSSSR